MDQLVAVILAVILLAVMVGALAYVARRWPRGTGYFNPGSGPREEPPVVPEEPEPPHWHPDAVDEPVDDATERVR